MNHFRIKPGYSVRSAPIYFQDEGDAQSVIVHQPDVYSFAAALGRKFGCTRVLDIGCGQARKLSMLHPEFTVSGVDFGPNIEWCRRHHRFGNWIEHDLESVFLCRHPAQLGETVIICSDVIEHLNDPTALIESLRTLLERAPVAILSTPERDRVRGPADQGPPANPAHVREWNLEELRVLLTNDFGLNLAFLGLTRNNDRDNAKKTQIAVLHGNYVPRPQACAAPDFRVLAFMTAYNEADFIEASIAQLYAQGVQVHLIDNWSTDGTFEIARDHLRPMLAGLERFPADGPFALYEWHRLLTRVEQLAANSDAEWCIHHDVDEIRESPWPDLTLRDGIHLADRMGFSAIDHTVINFHPINDDFLPGVQPQSQFEYWDFGTRSGHFSQVKAWKNTGQRIQLAESGGHEACFPGRRVFPYKFLLRHYPIRSTAHGRRKVFSDRLPRFSPFERDTRQWHSHYDDLSADQCFLRSPDVLTRFEPLTFYDEFLVERLSGIGIFGSSCCTGKTLQGDRGRNAPIGRLRNLLGRLGL